MSAPRSPMDEGRGPVAAAAAAAAAAAPAAAGGGGDLAIAGLTVRRGPCPVVDDVSFTARAGAVTALMGPNGAGKSTLLKAVLGLLPASGGMRLGAIDLGGLSAQERARLVAYVPQRSALSAPLSVRNVVAMGRFAHHGPLSRLAPADAAAVDAALAATDATQFAGRRFIDLSAGEQQRVLVARALATGAGAICLDEPSAALDIGHALALDALLRRLASEGRAVLVVLHQPDEVRRVADQAVLMHRGRCVEVGPPAAVLASGGATAAFGVVFQPGAGLGAVPVAAAATATPEPFPAPRPAPPPRPPGRRRGWQGAINAGLVAAALAIGMAAALAARPPAVAVGTPSERPASPADILAALPDGQPAVIGSDGVLVPARAWQRIAGASIVADSILPDLVEPERIVAASRWSVGPDAVRLGARPRIADPNDLDAILAIRPDLVVINTYPGQAQATARLRAAGIAVLDLGPAKGAIAAERAFRLIGAAVGRAEAGERLATAFRRRLDRVAAALPPGRPRPTAVLLTPLLDKLYGGAAGTSYSDVIAAAGLIDAAAQAGYRDWPDYTPEQLLTLDPEIIVTTPGSAQVLRNLPGLARLRAVRGPGRIIEIDQALLANAGPLMIDAAETLHAAVFAP